MDVYKIEVLIKSSQQYNKVDIYNEIRAIKGVVVCTIETNDFLNNKSNERFEFSLLHLKFTLEGTPEDSLLRIKKDCLITHKIKGLLQFIPRFQTLTKV